MDINLVDIEYDPLYSANDSDKNDNKYGESKLVLCVGPMFAGKTKFLLETINELNNDKKVFLVIKPIIDVRYNNDKITSHDGISYDCISLNSINEIDFNNIPSIVLIDEGQFFPDLYESVIKLLNLGKTVYISGLNGDFRMKDFGQMNMLYSLADKIIFKHAICNCSSPASFTARIHNDDRLVLIGGNNLYVPTCKKCYCDINKSKLKINNVCHKYMEM